MKREKTFQEKLDIWHRWNKHTGLYSFMSKIIVKLLIIIALIVGAVLVLNHFFNLSKIIEDYIFSHDTPGVLTLFLISESFLGWIPPDLFIMWSDKFNSPLLEMKGDSKWTLIYSTFIYQKN